MASPDNARGTASGCGCTPRVSVTACFERGRQRQRLPELTHRGHWIGHGDQIAAGFSVELSGGIVSEIRFRATTCVTLVAYCERLCELSRGLTPVAILHLRAGQLVDALRGVPRQKQDRASIAVTALHSAVAAAITTTQLETS